MTKNEFIKGIIEKEVISFGNLTIDGEVAPYYVDIRSISSHPELFRYAVESFGKYFETKKFDSICGVATASLPTIGGLTQQFGYPTIYHRPHKKDNGRPESLVEGSFKEGDNVYILDDLTITAELSMDFIKSVESVGINVKGYAVIFEKKSAKQCSIPYKEIGYEFFSIFNHEDLMEVIEEYSLTSNPTQSIKLIEEFAMN